MGQTSEAPSSGSKPDAADKPAAASDETQSVAPVRDTTEKGAHSRTRTRELLVVLLTAIAVVVGSELAFRRVCPPKYVREVKDAVAELEREDPTVLVLGSSHARTFAYMDAIARERTAGQTRILSVPVEWGKFRSYEWVLEHRVEPLLNEHKPDGSLVRPSVKTFILTTAWWDACWYEGDPPVFNLPSRAWALDDFVAAVKKDGLNDHSRNYLTSRWGDLWHGSILVSDRGHGALPVALRAAVKPMSAEALEAQHQQHLDEWRAMVERGKSCINHPAELGALERILDWAEVRGYDTTLMLYPMMPTTMTEAGIETVQKPFIAAMRAVARRRHIRFIDATFDPRVGDDDFQEDFDHLKPESHVRYSQALLDKELSFLLAPPGAAARGEMR